MKILAADSTGIARATELLLAGKIISYPTETLYAVGGDATDEEAVAQVVRAKGRPDGIPIPLIVADREMLARFVVQVPEVARRLMAAHWPGPLTVVLGAVRGLPEALQNGEGGVGFRISADPVASALTRGLGRPLTATSANRSGALPATRAGDVRLPGLSLVLDGGGRSEPPSTVIDVTGGRLRVLRRGAVAVSADQG